MTRTMLILFGYPFGTCVFVRDGHLCTLMSWTDNGAFLIDGTQPLHRVERFLIDDLGENLQSCRGLERRLKGWIFSMDY